MIEGSPTWGPWGPLWAELSLNISFEIHLVHVLSISWYREIYLIQLLKSIFLWDFEKFKSI